MLIHVILALAVVRIVSHSLPAPLDLCPTNMCAPEETCCKTKNAFYACCPVSKATCCLDGSACCPMGYACNNTTPSTCIPQDGALLKPTMLRTEYAYNTTQHVRRHIINVRSGKTDQAGRSTHTQLPNIAHLKHGHATNKTIPSVSPIGEVMSTYLTKMVDALLTVYTIYSRSFKGEMLPDGKLIHKQYKTQLSLERNFSTGNSVNRNVDDNALCGNSVCVDRHPCCKWTTNKCCYYYQGVCCPDLDNICCPMGYVCDPTATGMCRVPY